MSVDFTLRESIATVVLNRPEVMNSLDSEARTSLAECWTRIRTDAGIRVAILTGAGDRAFCTGSDLKKTMPPPESFAELTFGGAVRDDENAIDIGKPLICAINGYALGGGLELALSCDIRIASDTARFGLPEVGVGTIPGAGGTQRLPRIVGLTNALPLLLSGDIIDSAEALRIGLVSKVVPAADLMAAADAIAERIASAAPLAVRAIKRLVDLGSQMPLQAAIEMERLSWGALRDTADRIEGRRAFQEKRPPVFRGA